MYKIDTGIGSPNAIYNNCCFYFSATNNVHIFNFCTLEHLCMICKYRLVFIVFIEVIEIPIHLKLQLYNIISARTLHLE